MTPEWLASPPAAMSIATGELVYQPAEQAAVLHWTELVGAAAVGLGGEARAGAREARVVLRRDGAGLSVPAVASKL